MTTFLLAGVDVPRVGLGTNRLTTEHVDFVREAAATGVRHIDTAHLYHRRRERARHRRGARRRSPVVPPIPGTRSIEHQRENLAALELALGHADLGA